MLWEGEGTTRCVLGEKSWEPLDGGCWYPVDLDVEPGSLTLVRVRSGKRQMATVRVGEYPYAVQRLEVDDSQVHLSPEDLARARRERQRVEAALARRTPRRFTLPLAAPLAELPEGGRFGARRVFNGEPRSPHSGVDYSAPTGTPVRAVADGVVALAEDHFFAGKGVFVDHGGALVTMYFHLSEITVAQGEQVERGAVIGRVGATGRATGPHLHFGVRWHGARIDPAFLFEPERVARIGGGSPGR